MSPMERINLVRASTQYTSLREASRDLGVKASTLWRWRTAYERYGIEGLADKRPGRCGRKSAPVSATDAAKLRHLYVKSNRDNKRGSKTLAARVYACSSHCSEELREAILRPRTSKHTLPKSVRDAMEVPRALVDHHRSPRRATLNGLHAPGVLRMSREAGERRRLLAGVQQSWDDLSINRVLVVPWPWGGDKCSDRFGVRVGRYQLLGGTCSGSEFCGGFSYVMRPQQSYRGADVVGAMYRDWRDIALPEEVVAEGGVWQSIMALEWYRRIGVRVVDAKGRPHQKLVEGFWNRWHSVESLQPGQVGRFRGEMERETKLMIQAQQGRLDPRGVFPALTEAMRAAEASLTFLNSEPVHSKKYGTWVPQERHRADLEEHPRPRLDPEISWAALPEQHERTVVKGAITCTVPGPLGFSLPYTFSSEDLWEWTGVKLRVHFDPFDAPPVATITLPRPMRGLPEGHVVARRAACLDDAPTIMRLADGAIDIGFDECGLSRALAIRRAQAQALRTEYRAIGFGGRRVAASSDARDGVGNRQTVDLRGSSIQDQGTTPNRQEADTPRAPVRRALTGAAGGQRDISHRMSAADLDAELAEVERIEAEARAADPLWGT